MAGQRELSEAELNLNKRDMARNLKSDADKNQKGWNAGIGGILGAAGAGLAAGGIAGLVTGSVTGPGALITAAIDASIGLISGIVTGIVQETSTDTETDAIDLLAQQAEKDETFLARLKAGEVSSDELKTIGIEDEGLIASL
jgi:L-serine deaminase